MKIIITRKQDLTTTTWSGGTTTQLAIYPPGSTLQERNFLFRISTAKVESESSTFTMLPGVRRMIMILEGQLDLEHVGHYSKTLKKSETDVFPGDLETRSHGKVTDFNLMTTGKVSGTAEMINISQDHSVSFPLHEEENIMGIYVLKGVLNFVTNVESGMLETGDFLLVFQDYQNETVSLKGLQKSEFVKVKIKLK